MTASLTWLGADGPVTQRELAEHGRARVLANRAVAAVEACDRAFFAAGGDDVGALAGLLRRLVATG